MDLVPSKNDVALRPSQPLDFQPLRSKNGEIWSKIDRVKSFSVPKTETMLYIDWNCSRLINFKAMGILLFEHLSRLIFNHYAARMVKFGQKLTELGQFQCLRLKLSYIFTGIARD